VAQLNRNIRGRQPNLREMLLAAGIGEFNATMSIPYMYFLPSTTDPYAQGVIQIVEGLQNLLNARGLLVPIDGWMGPETINAVMRYAGASWRDKSWMQIYGDVLRGQLAPGFAPPEPTDELAGYIEETGLGDLTTAVTDLVTSPIGLVAGGALAYLLWRSKKRPNPARRSRRARA